MTWCWLLTWHWIDTDLKLIWGWLLAYTALIWYWCTWCLDDADLMHAYLTQMSIWIFACIMLTWKWLDADSRPTWQTRVSFSPKILMHQSIIICWKILRNLYQNPSTYAITGYFRMLHEYIYFRLETYQVWTTAQSPDIQKRGYVEVTRN